MRIMHNIAAMNASFILDQNNSKIKKQLEKLSSGYRINSAADDASGLGVSEKMRALKTGLQQAKRNSNDGISLLQVGEGALQEVHGMLNRIKELADQSSNGTYQDETDREALQRELEEILSEVDRISKNTNFNGINLFQDRGYNFETTNGRFEIRQAVTKAAAGPKSLKEFLADAEKDQFNIIYTETTDFVTNQNGTGTTSDAWDSTGIREKLEREIIPNVVASMLTAYPAFTYLAGSSIGIGLDLYADAGSNVLASVTSSTNSVSMQSYKLSVNMAKVDLTTSDGRSALERTISHEMMHAFMFEADTKGMLTGGGDKFPSWFVEGMAQTTCGPENWMGALGIGASSSAAQIQAAVSSGVNKLGSGTGSSEYGTGYLACMYLGFKASGETVVNADNIAKGLSKILKQVTSGDSLNKTFQTLTGYNSVSAFETAFAGDAAGFIHDLFVATGAGAGGVISGDLTATDLISDANLAGINLFKLDKDHQTVENYYPSDVNINSGGTVNGSGTPPVADYAPKVTYPEGIFSVGGSPVASGVPGSGYEYDVATGTLHIKAAGTYRIAGGSFIDAASGSSFSGKIVLDDNIAGNVNLILDGLTIDRSADVGTAAVHLGKGNDVSVTLGNGKDNVLKSGENSAGLQLGEGTNLTISDEGAGTGKLETYGGKGGAGIGVGYHGGTSGFTGGDIVIHSGDIKAIGGTGGGAGIGGGYQSSIGDITINGGKIWAESLEHGAGIGGGWTGLSQNGKITITGGDITAKGIMHGTGIGAGCSGHSKDITISGGKIHAQGGNEGAGIGASWNGSCDDITITGGNIVAEGGQKGAGIGAGSIGACKDILIDGSITNVVISATGGPDGAGIGCGVNGTGGDIRINGGTITAKGGLTYDGGNIGNYSDTKHHTPTSTVIDGGASVKAGDAGEGLYNTNGAVNSAGESVYSLPVALNGKTITKIQSVSKDGETLNWTNSTTHEPLDSQFIYIWMKGADQTVTVDYADGTSDILDLVFYQNAGVWRKRGEAAPPPAVEPNNPSDPPVPPTPGGDTDNRNTNGGIILQIGTDYEDILEVPVFYFSVSAIQADGWSVATQADAYRTLGSVDDAINRVSSMRGTYGAMQNRLEYSIRENEVTYQNITDSESRIRDADMAMEMMGFITGQILSQTAQTMLTQANTRPQEILKLLQ